MNPLCEKYSFNEKQIDSSSSTTRRWGASGALESCFVKILRNRPDTRFRARKGLLDLVRSVCTSLKAEAYRPHLSDVLSLLVIIKHEPALNADVVYPIMCRVCLLTTN